MNPEVPILVLSCPEREDVVPGYLRSRELYWPRPPGPVEILSDDTSRGWNARLQRRLASWNTEFLILQLDDFYYGRPVDGQAISRAIEAMANDRSIGIVQLVGGVYPEIEYPLSGFRRYDKKDRLYKRTQLTPTLVRTSLFVPMLARVVQRLSKEDDRGWIGAYNYELVAGSESVAFEALGTTEPPDRWPIFTVNVLQQDRYTSQGIALLRHLGLPVDTARRGIFDPEGPQPYVEAWRASRENHCP